MRYIARSASDKTDDWPAWMITSNGINVTGKVLRELHVPFPLGSVLSDRDTCETYAKIANDIKLYLTPWKVRYERGERSDLIVILDAHIGMKPDESLKKYWKNIPQKPIDKR